MAPKGIHMISNLTFISHNDDLALLSLAQGVRRFAEKEIQVAPGIDPSFSREQFTKMAALGLSGATVPEIYGGTKLSTLETSLILFEISRTQLGPAIYLSVHQMVSKILSNYWKSESAPIEIKKLATGEMLGAFCLTEAGAGSDASALKTKAEIKDSGYELTGEKIYITSAGLADLYLVFARTSPDIKNGISAFVVHKDDKGISFGPHEKKMGGEGSPIAVVTFEKCLVPHERLVGQVGEGYKIALSALAGGRVSISACACGVASKATELALNFSKQRSQFGKNISEFQGIQFMLADMFTRTKAAILLTREAALAMANNDSTVLLASAAKCFATDAAMQTTTDAVQVFGGAGYLKDYEVERLMRDAKMLQIVEGTNQIQRMVIARELLRD